MMHRPLGPYQIEERLATGGMAEVFVAKRVGLHGFTKRVALKRILPQFSHDSDFVRMFVDEARLAARLEHPNIVQVFDFGELGGDLFIAMELVDGTNVNRLLRAVSSRGEAVPLESALNIASETAHALAHAHRATDDAGREFGIVHRDVSPANILITRSGHVKLSDFGIARIASAEQQTDEGHVRGKLGYMSPEQVMGKSLDGRSDVFTLTTVLAEMLIAEPLFGQGKDIDVLLRIRDVDLRVLERSQRRIPQDVLGLIKLGFARDPRDRPTSWQFADAIDHVLRRRGAGQGHDRVARLLQRLELTPGTGPSVPKEGPAEPGARPTSLMDTTGLSHATEMLANAGAYASQSLYRVQTKTGETMGPLSFPKLVQLITTGRIDGDTLIAHEEGPFKHAASFTELTRFVSSNALRWSPEETSNVTLRGRLEPGKLLPLVYKLTANHETGVLFLMHGDRRKKIYFVDGRPEFVASTDHSELLGEYLVAAGMCLKMEVDMALALLPRYGGRLGDALVGLGILRPVELFRAIAGQVRMRYLEGFRWHEGEWAWVRGARSHEETFPLGLDPFELFRDAAAEMHIEELEMLLLGHHDRVLHPVVSPSHPIAAFRLSDSWQAILSSIDGTDASRFHVLLETSRQTGLGRTHEDVHRAVFLGLSCGLIALTAPDGSGTEAAAE